MSSSGPNFHIPFPSNFLSLNSPLKRSSSIDGGVVSPADAPAHNFLSNRPAVPRHPSVSSITSDSSADSTRSAPPTPIDAAISPILASKGPAFLPLNNKFAAPARNARPVIGNKNHSFLSNRH